MVRTQHRRLACIVVADIVGFSALTKRDEAGAHARLKALLHSVVKPLLRLHKGRLVKTTGDGFIGAFDSPSDALLCSVAIQSATASQETEQADPITYRVGVNLGEIIVEADGDVFGDGVNVAARLESLADPGGILVSGKVYDEVSGKLAMSFVDLGDRVVKNIARPVRVFAVARDGLNSYVGSSLPEARHPQAAVEPSRSEPHVVVLPFHTMDPDADTRLICDGIVEEVTHALSCFKTIAVLANHTARAIGKNAPEQAGVAARHLGADYLVEGTMVVRASQFRISITLCEAKSGRRLWAQSFSAQPDDIFAWQQNAVLQIASTLISNIETAASRIVPSVGNLQSYVAMLRGIALLRSYGEGVNEEARTHLQKAIQLDPNLGLAHAYLALAELIIAGYRTASHAVKDRLRDRALHAIALSPDEARCHRILGLVLLYRNEFAAAERHFACALEINPYDADTLAQVGYMHAQRGRPNEGLRLIDRAIALNPMHPPWYYFDRGETLINLDRYRDAAECFACLPRKDLWHWARMAACYALDNSSDLARTCVEQAQLLYLSKQHDASDQGETNPFPDIEDVLNDAAYEHDRDRDRLRRGLERAGWDRVKAERAERS